MSVLGVIGVAALCGIRARVSGNSMEYSVVLNGNDVLLKGGDTCVRSNGRRHCVSDGFLRPQGSPVTMNGTNAYGAYTAVSYTWEPVPLKTTIFNYEKEDLVLFRQEYLENVNGSKEAFGNKNGLVSVFPSFEVPRKELPGYLQYFGHHSGCHFVVGNFSLEPLSPELVEGLEGGPLAMFNPDKEVALVVSPASEFMSASQAASIESNTLRYGLMGGVETIPKGFVLDTIIVLSPVKASVRAGMRLWGDKLLHRYGKTRKNLESDVTVRYLQYSTDAGGYYYYNTEPEKNYQETMIDVFKYATQAGIPYKNWLMDSWWYLKGARGGVKNWTARADVFPSRTAYVYQHMGRWPITAHSKQWASDNVYAKQNGGEFEFVIEPSQEIAMPVDTRFWGWLLGEGRKWGLSVLRRDYLAEEFLRMNWTTTSATNARKSMLLMNEGAAQSGVFIQYCTALARHIMQSVEAPQVTQARATEDYNPGLAEQWRGMGVTGMLLDAVALAPSKDSFYSSDRFHKPKAPAYARELHSKLQAVVSVLSAGPVAVSDKNGETNVELVLHLCNKDGLLLTPDRPARMLDALLFMKSQATEQMLSQVWAASSTIGSTVHPAWYVFAAETISFDLRYEEIFYDSPGTAQTAFAAWEASAPFSVRYFRPGDAVSLDLTTLDSSNLWTFAPVLLNGYVLMGEATTKFVSLSGKRFSGYMQTAGGFVVAIKGAVGEEVKVLYLAPGSTQPITVTCVIPAVGVATLAVP